MGNCAVFSNNHLMKFLVPENPPPAATLHKPLSRALWWRALLGLSILALPARAQSRSTLGLEQSTNLQTWQAVPVTPAMLDAQGRIQVHSDTDRGFYRLQVPTGFSLIPAGSFTMGRTSGDTDVHAPPVDVTVSAFYMGKTEVTKALWDEVRIWAEANGYTFVQGGEGKASNHPVQTVKWYDVIKWCNARSEKEGLTPVYYTNDAQTAVYKTGEVDVTNTQVKWAANGYRLPTEAEWEKAARGGLSGYRFPWGDTISQSQANYHGNTGGYDDGPDGFNPIGKGSGQPKIYTSPVGSFAANGYGLYDMVGNVAERCWDWYGATTYVDGATDPRGAESGSYRVYRGGSWNNNANNCRVADRNNSNPTSSNYDIGFRVARSSVP